VKFLLDANVLVCALNDTAGVRRRLNEAQASGAKLLTSAVVVGELSFGASASARPEQNHARLRAMLARMEVVPFTETAAQRFGDIKASLRRRGLARGDADLQIASTAIVEDATLVTDDQALLDRSIPELRTENWTGARRAPDQVSAGGRAVHAHGGLVRGDGDLFHADAGSVRADGGSVRTHGGSVRADGGLIHADGGSVRADGALVATDGGLVHADGGLVRADGGIVDADGGLVSADIGLVSADGGLVTPRRHSIAGRQVRDGARSA